MTKVLPLIICTFYYCSICITSSFAQVPLDTFIGANHLPADNDSITNLLIWPDVTPDLEGPLEGTLVHDFKLYTIDGDSVQMSGLLNDRKPVLLIGCNYTCYVFRGKIDVINDLKATYGDAIKIYLVYTVEAHPVIDVSPYFGVENVGADNYAEGILYRQPLTYGERKIILSEMLANEDIQVPVLLDGSANNWWLNYGTAPNCAFLIDPDGYVFDAQNWFNKAPENIYASIDSLLGIVGEGSYNPTGIFTAVSEGEDIYYGAAGNIISAHVTLSNTSSDDVLIDFLRTENSIPEGWLSFICTDLCFSPDQDSTSVYLLPGQSQTVRVDFYTNDTPADGFANITFKNRVDASNTYSYAIHAQSVDPTFVHDTDTNNPIRLYPNPAAVDNMLNIYYTTTNSSTHWQMLNMDGSEVQSGALTNEITTIYTSGLASGIYFIRIQDNDATYSSPVILADH